MKDEIDERLKRYEPFFGKWLIGRMLGTGSFGQVVEIYWEDGLGNRTISALKFMHVPDRNTLEVQREEQPDEQAVYNYFRKQVDRIYEEIAILQRCKGHSNIVSYEDHMIQKCEDEFGWDILIRMERLYPIGSFFARKEATQYDVVRMWLDVANALIYCEDQNIIHRDIKPANILISVNGRYKLTDFGVAKKNVEGTDAETKAGTVRYMAPEVARMETYNRRADYYSLGDVIYYFLNRRRHPFTPPYPQEITAEDLANADQMRFSGKKIPLLPNVSKEVNAVLQKSLAYRPGNRYQNARDLYRAVEKLLETQEAELRSRYLNADGAEAGAGSSFGSHRASSHSRSSHTGSSGKKSTIALLVLAGTLLTAGAGGIVYGVYMKKAQTNVSVSGNDVKDSRETANSGGGGLEKVTGTPTPELTAAQEPTEAPTPKPEPTETPTPEPETAETTEQEPETAETTEQEPETAETTEQEPETAETTEQEPETAETTEQGSETAETTEQEPETAEATEQEPETAETTEQEPTPEPTATPTPEPTATPTPEPTETPTPEPTATPTPEPTATPTPEPTATPTPEPTATPTPEPTATPTPEPTATPTPTPSPSPTPTPSPSPTPVPTAPLLGSLERPVDGDSIDGEIKVKGWILANASMGELEAYGDILSDGTVIESFPLSLSALGENTFAKRQEKYSTEIAAAAGYEVKGSYSVENIPDGSYQLGLRAVDPATGTEETLGTAEITISTSQTGGDVLDYIGVTEESQTLYAYYTSEEKGFAIGLDIEEDNAVMTANPNQVLLTGWINAQSGSSVGLFVTIDGQVYTSDAMTEAGGELTISRVPRNLDLMDGNLIGTEIRDTAEAGLIVEMKLPFLSAGEHTVAVTFNVAAAGAENEMADIMPVTVTLDESVSVNENAQEELAQAWADEFPEPTEAQTEESTAAAETAAASETAAQP